MELNSQPKRPVPPEALPVALRTPPVGPRTWKERLFRVVPALDSLRRYTLRAFRADLVAGLTVAAVAVPQAMAYALVAGLDPKYGLYSAIVLTCVAGLFSSSWQLINGPTNAISIALLCALAEIPNENKAQAATLMCLMVGLFHLGLTSIRFGDLTQFISPAVIVGFTTGAGFLLLLEQTKNMLGLPAPHASPTDHFLWRYWLTILGWRQVNLNTAGWTLGIGTVTIGLILGLRWVNQRFRLRVPEYLTVVGFMAALVWGCNLENQGVVVIGHIPSNPLWFGFPVIEWGQVHKLAYSAMAIALVGLFEALAMAKALAVEANQHPDMNQQCLAEGVAHVTGSFFHCFPGSGSLTRSALNQQAGAATQWAGIISSVAVALVVLLFAPLAYYIPRATLAGMLVISAYRLIDPERLVYYLQGSRFDVCILLTTALSAIVISIEFSILFGVIASCVHYLPHAASAILTERPPTAPAGPSPVLSANEPGRHLLIYSLDGELLANPQSALEERLDAIGGHAVEGTGIVVIRFKRVGQTDPGRLAVLDRFVRHMEAHQVKVLVYGLPAALGASPAGSAAGSA